MNTLYYSTRKAKKSASTDLLAGTFLFITFVILAFTLGVS